MSATPIMKKIIWTLLLTLTLTGLVACGGGGGDSTADGSPSGPISGIAVDPYIEGAMFQEIAADGVTVLQRQSSASDALGRFSFPQATTVGSTIVMKASAKGMHQGAPFEGILKRKVTAAGDDALVVSPMTTVLANGSSEAELLAELQRAGFAGLSAADLTADPLAALPTDPATISDANLKALQANLALNAVMAARNNYDLSAGDLRGTDTALLFDSLALGVRETLNSALCQELAAAVAAAPQLDSSKAPLTVSDLIATAVQLQRNLIAVAKESLAANGGRLDPVVVDNAIFQALQQAPAMALEKHQQSTAGGTPAPVPVPAPTPAPAPNGQALYNALCAVCHSLGSVDPSGFAGELGGKGTLIGSKLAAGHQNLAVSSAEAGAIGSFADANAPAPAPTPAPTPTPAPGPDYSNCTACHGQPPSGTSFPNTRGAHAVHAALPTVGNNCQICHSGSSHNGDVELAFPAAYNAKSGAARDNGNGTCSNISCHGGNTSPDWWSGSIAVNTQCTSCHASGSAQYNSYSSGEHSLHNNRGYACTVCHSTTKLASSHFGGLNTSALNSAAAGIGGSGTRVTSYTVSGSTKTCATSCHGNERW